MQRNTLERASWGAYLLIPADQGPDALGYGNLLALASRIADPYYIGFSTAAAHYGYGLTTQHRNVIYVVTPVRLRGRKIGEAQVQIVNLSESKFFGFEPVDVLGYKVVTVSGLNPSALSRNRLFRTFDEAKLPLPKQSKTPAVRTVA